MNAGAFFYLIVFVIACIGTVMCRVITGKWMGNKGMNRIEAGFVLVLAAAMAGVTFWYA